VTFQKGNSGRPKGSKNKTTKAIALQIAAEQGEIGRDLFRVACSMGLEGIVSKRRDCAYAPGKCRHWVKTKNLAHPAYSRVRDQLLVTRSRKSRAKP
jgi:ATP-dependent DNA ligase